MPRTHRYFLPHHVRHVVLAAVMALHGCGGLDPVHVRDDWNGTRDGIRTIVVAPAKVRMYAARRDGSSEEISEWSAKASEHVTSSVIAQLQRPGGPSVSRITEGKVPAELVPRFRLMQAQFEIVNAQIIADLYGASSKPARKPGGRLDYSLGSSVSAVTGADPVDGIVMTWGIDHELETEIAAPTRSSAPRFEEPLTADPLVRWGATYMSMAFVDARTGNVLWFRYLTNVEGSNYELKNPISAAAIVRRLVNGFLAGRPGGR